ncbi:hypothetical protein DL767_003709 [Monosporascus sp. MG133]|nr:hypothetical protein DL767_003709 [Monosporascus sp. MG133]
MKQSNFSPRTNYPPRPADGIFALATSEPTSELKARLREAAERVLGENVAVGKWIRNKPLARILPRSATNKASQSSLVHTGIGLSLLDLSDDEKGILGLSTLYEPPNSAFANIIFIHGLGGGSRKTWSFSPDIQHFWPLQWLPEDPDFRSVRILTFGYKAGWGERSQSVLNIHDFAQSLIGELRNHPRIRQDATRIVLVGHSMGGCVAKKAYIIARQDPTCRGLAERFHSMFFLGTPHRGSDLAAVLESMLLVAWGKKPFVTDLTPNSAALTELNDTFRHFAPELRLWSFYETLPVKVKVMNRIVVEKASATLGFSNEEIAAMNADHRHICKFESRSDPSFRMLRNALHTAIDMIQSTIELPPGYAGIDSMHSGQSGQTPAEIISSLRTFLGVHDSLDEDLAGLQVLKEPGSCLWFSESVEFTTWKARKSIDIFWLTGKPASGKSVLSSHVIDLLRSTDGYCSYFFFKHGHTGKATLSDCLRSLAFQMATHDAMLREKLSLLEEEGTIWDKADEVSLWKKIFVSIIFRLPTIVHHTWVIDALDECANFNALFTKRLLATLPKRLCLFVTSRDLEEIGRGIVSLGPRVVTKAVSDTDTLADMRLFLNTKLTELNRLDNEESRKVMGEKILRKSSGSFLWVRLILQEFENAWTQEAMEAVLEEIPADLYKMYTRMVQAIEADKRKLVLAKSILAWVVLSSRPLTLDELRCAVKLDINQTLQNMEKAVPSICGQLVSIGQGNKVHMIHETAREYFLSDNMFSELAIHKAHNHTRLASLTLQYLSSDVLKPRPAKAQLAVRARGFGKLVATATPDSSFLGYASQFFSDHVYRGTSESDELMEQLSDFLVSANVLSWIEEIAKRNELSIITRTAMNLRGYLGRRTKYVSPTDPSIYVVDSWITDLIRVAAKFRSHLLACPSSIHCLIPPLCPSDSIIARTFAKDTRSTLIVKGAPKGNWDDCLLRIDFRTGQTTAVHHGDKYLAVGLSTGRISIYGTVAFQQVQKMEHPERIRMLQGGPGDELLASVGSKHVVVWEPKLGKKIRTFPLQSTPLAVVFLSSQELLCAFQSGHITKWDIDTGDSATISWKQEDNYGRPIEFDVPEQPPSRMTFMVACDDVLLAVGYRSHPIFIWNALELQVLGQCGSEFNNGIDDMAFNPNPEVDVLVVSYNNGVLCLFNYSTMEMTFKKPDVHAYSLACSPDGRSLVTGSNQGKIEVFEFDQDNYGNTILLLIHRINAFDDSIRCITFNYDGLQFVDVRGQQCRVWAPAALLRKDSELESTSDAVPMPPKTFAMLDTSEEPEITSRLVVSNDGTWAVAGKSNGSVVLLSAADGSEISCLYQHAKGVSITCVALGEQQGLVISADDSGRILIAKIATRPLEIEESGKLSLSTVIFGRRFRTAVVDILVNARANRLLLTLRDINELLELPSGMVLGEWPLEKNSNSLFPDGRYPRPAAPMSRSPSPDRAGSGEATATGGTQITIRHPRNDEWRHQTWAISQPGDAAIKHHYLDYSGF